MRTIFMILLVVVAVAAAVPVLAQSDRDMPAGVSGGVGTGSGMGTGATTGVIRGGAVSGATPGVTRREESPRTQTGVPATPDTPTTIDRQTGLPTSQSASPANRPPEDPRELISPRVRARQSGDAAPATPALPSGVTAPAGPRPTR
jgi:hypothetical protein